MPALRGPAEMRTAILRSLPEKTGRSLDEWVTIVRGAGLGGFKPRVDWLKAAYGLGHSTAFLVVSEAEKPADFVEPSADALLAKQYAGAKAALLPIYERAAGAARSLGEDVRVEARQTYMTFTRGKQFAVIQPVSSKRVDIGLIGPHLQSTERLQPAGSFGSGRVTHRVALGAPEDVDAELLAWLHAAYEWAAG
ncbi:MAG TPA: DUF5655 domain-containing protein [Dehalococcoidia bacterium]|nr:DUF5655 domain-containing protein [Dehalococcoidia bacterium]